MGGVSSLEVNGVQVFESVPDFMEYLNASTISESDFLNKVCIADTFDKINTSTNLPYAKDFVGKTITGISNTYNSSSNVDWEIIDYNHDSTSGTFDLMAKRSIKDSIQFYSNGKYNQNYEFSTIRTWIQSYANNFSSLLSSRLATMDVVYNFNTNQPNNQAYSNYPGDSNKTTTGDNKHTLNDKIKLLSAIELGYAYGINYMPNSEGTRYSRKFSYKTNMDINSNMIWYSGSSGSAVDWWLRSRYADSSYGYSVWYVAANGQLSGDSTDRSHSAVPVIRLSV